MKVKLSGIRVAYSGLISLISGLASVIMGLIFTLVVTRTLDPMGYGTWGLIGGLVTYSTILEPIISYWITRETARGIESGKTAILSGNLFSIGGVLIYVVVSYVVVKRLDVDLTALLFATILIPVIYMNRILTAINAGYMPHVPGYGQIVFGITEILSGLFFVYFFHMGIFGVILSVGLAYVTSILTLLIYARNKIRNKIKLEYLKKWIRLSWIPLYPAINGIILSLDVMIFSLITGSVLGLAFWSAVIVISSFIVSSGLVTRATYAKLLHGGDKGYLEESIRHLFYFAILFTAISITFSKEALFILNPIYQTANLVVIIMSVQVFFYTITGNLQTLITGVEQVDISTKSTIKDYLKSKLFFIPTMSLIQSITYVSLLSVGILFLLHTTKSTTMLLIYWSIISLATQIPFAMYTLILAKRTLRIKIDHISILKYLLVGVGVFGLTYYIAEKSLVYKNNVFEFFPNLLLYVFLATISFIIITSLVDSKTKKLIRSIIDEFKTKY